METAAITSFLAPGILASKNTNSLPPTVKMEDLHPPLTPDSSATRQSASPAPSLISTDNGNSLSSFHMLDSGNNQYNPNENISGLLSPPHHPDASSPNSKGARKRKSWGQELPEPKTNLPPRKRAKTEDEKEQRRIERVKRNRLAAHNSRERKRHEVELLQVEKDKIEQRLRSSEQDVASLMDCMRKMAAQIEAWKQYVPQSARTEEMSEAITLPNIPNSLTITGAATTLLKSSNSTNGNDGTNTINPRQASLSSPEPQLSSGIESPLDTSSQPATPVELASPNLMPTSTHLSLAAAVNGDRSDRTQHSAAMLCDPQCRSDLSTLTSPETTSATATVVTPPSKAETSSTLTSGSISGSAEYSQTAEQRQTLLFSVLLTLLAQASLAATFLSITSSIWTWPMRATLRLWSRQVTMLAQLRSLESSSSSDNRLTFSPLPSLTTIHPSLQPSYPVPSSLCQNINNNQSDRERIMSSLLQHCQSLFYPSTTTTTTTFCPDTTQAPSPAPSSPQPATTAPTTHRPSSTPICSPTCAQLLELATSMASLQGVEGGADGAAAAGRGGVLGGDGAVDMESDQSLGIEDFDMKDFDSDGRSTSITGRMNEEKPDEAKATLQLIRHFNRWWYAECRRHHSHGLQYPYSLTNNKGPDDEMLYSEDEPAQTRSGADEHRSTCSEEQDEQAAPAPLLSSSFLRAERKMMRVMRGAYSALDGRLAVF